MLRGPSLLGVAALIAAAPLLARSDVPQQLPTLPPASPIDPAIDPATSMGSVEFAHVDSRMTVPVSVSGKGPFPFFVDTGAERTVISRQLAEQLGLPAGPRVNLTALGGTSSVATVVIPELEVTPLAASRNIAAPALEAQHLGGSGLLGVDALDGRAVTIDFDRGEMRVRKAEVARAPRPKPDEIIVTARNKFGQLIVTNAAYRERRIRVIVDTGAAVSVGNLALYRQVARTRVAIGPMSFTSVTGEHLEIPAASVDEVRIGTMTMSGLPIAFADLAPFEKLGLKEEPTLLLGMNALRYFRRVDIDFSNRRIQFLLPRYRARPSSLPITYDAQPSRI